MTATPFSIVLDGSSAVGNIEYLAVSARYLPSNQSSETIIKLIGLLELGDSSTGATLYKAVSSFLFSGDYGRQRRRNLLGIASDHASR